MPWKAWVCPKCSAMVGDPKKHRKWHSKQKAKTGPPGPPGPMGPMGPQGQPSSFSPLRQSQSHGNDIPSVVVANPTQGELE